MLTRRTKVSVKTSPIKRSCRKSRLPAGLICVASMAAIAIVTPASAQPSGQSPDMASVLSDDMPFTLPNGARFVAPKGWALRKGDGTFILAAPEADSHIAIISRDEEEASAAVKAAWALFKPDIIANAEGEERRAREGWERTIRFQYESLPRAQRTLLAFALAKGKGWTVMLYDVSDAVAARRDAQIEVIFNSLLPEGYARETFAGRTANRLDAKRIAQLTALIEEARREYDIPGVALGLIQDGEVVFSRGFGVRKHGGTEPVDANTLFNVASIGKSWTTLMLAKQVEAGRFSWDSPVNTLWPDFALGDPETTKAVQVRHLVCACTGMPRSDYGWLFEGENSTPRSIMRTLSQSQPTSAFGDTYQYSNLMAAAAGYFGGHMLYPRRELGSAYDAAMQRLVFDPLEMKSTTAVSSRALVANHASGHALDVVGRIEIASQGLNLASISTRPSGNHWSNVNDILRYMQMELSGGLLPDGKRYIAEEKLLARRLPQVTEGLNEHYGMGLKIDRQWGVTVIHHGGTAAGYRSHMMWLPDHGIGAVILINSDTGGILRTAFRRGLLEVIFDGKPVAAADLARLAPLEREANAEERKSLTFPPERASVTSLARRYRSPELGDLHVRQKAGKIWFDFGGWSSELASRKADDGASSFVTVSPGMSGYEFDVAERGIQKLLITREAQKEYIFEEVR